MRDETADDTVRGGALLKVHGVGAAPRLLVLVAGAVVPGVAGAYDGQ